MVEVEISPRSSAGVAGRRACVRGARTAGRRASSMMRTAGSAGASGARSVKTTSDAPSIVRKIGAGPGPEPAQPSPRSDRARPLPDRHWPSWHRWRPGYWRRLAAVARAAGRLSAAARPTGRNRGGRLGRLGRLAGVVVGNDTPDGGQDFLHRGLLDLRRLAHSCIPDRTVRTPHDDTWPRRHERIVACVPFIRQCGSGRCSRPKLRLPVMNCATAQRPSGVRTPAQLSRTCW